MKRFWQEVTVTEEAGGFRVALDGRPIRTQGGAAQIVPTQALAAAMAGEWRAQGPEIDPSGFVLRDLADFAIDKIAPDPAAAAGELLRYAETDTLCYRADPDEPLYRRQQELWEPLVAACEARHGIRLERVSGVMHRPQPAATIDRLRETLCALDPFTLAALRTIVPLTASVVIGFAAIAEDAGTQALFAAANCEEDWQAELWGTDSLAEQDRAARLQAFEAAARFARLARS